MNIERVLRITNIYFLLTGYQIRWFDRKSMRYSLTIWNVIYILIVCIIYLICFSHHFENSTMLKILLDMSLFLRNLVRLHALLCLKALIFCVIEWKNLNNSFNGLVNLLTEAIKRQESFDKQEFLTYLIFFSTFLVAFGFGLYITIELNFELPPLDHIMISLALFMPHFILAGCIRFYTLGLWLLKSELVSIKFSLKEQMAYITDEPNATVVEIVNPALTSTAYTNISYAFYGQLSERVTLMARYLKKFDCILQRQLTMLMGLNFNCLLAGFYSRIYFEKSWEILFTNRNRRIFYAANSAIFICILVDYGGLLLARWNFFKAKENLHKMIVKKLYEETIIVREIRTIFKSLKRELKQNFHLKLLGLAEFNTWNFILLHVWMISLIAMIIGYHYFNDQVVALNERLDLNETD